MYYSIFAWRIAETAVLWFSSFLMEEAMPQKLFRLQGNLPVIFLQEGDTFVAHSPVLDLSTCGSTYEEANKNFKEALQIFFEECIKHHTLDQALGSLGWHKATMKPFTWEPPIYAGEQQIPLDRISVA